MKNWKLNLLLFFLATFTVGNTLLLLPEYIHYCRHLWYRLKPNKWKKVKLTIPGYPDAYGWQRVEENGLTSLIVSEKEPAP